MAGERLTLGQLLEFARTIRLSHSLFALPFAVGTALLAEPPWPDGLSLALLVACMVAARTAAMGMNRVADASIDARNPRTANREIPAGRLPRGQALALTILSAANFVAFAWGFYGLRGTPWPGILSIPFLVVLFGYSWTKRFTALSHWVLGLALGLAPVGVWIALRSGEPVFVSDAWFFERHAPPEYAGLTLLPLVIGAAVLLWTAGFDILYALQDVEVDRREGLFSVPARLGPARARLAAAACHVAAFALLAAAPFAAARETPDGRLGLGSLLALGPIAFELAWYHIRTRRATAEEIAAAFFPTNATVSMLWLAGVVLDVVAGLSVRMH